tara:strand:+ start:211 stop:690 length:480 start_codon:yes stop_codon:yes gene_type:complete
MKENIFNRNNYTLLEISSVIDLERANRNKLIYLLVKNNEVVYVGQSNRGVLSRLSSHIKNKDFDEVFYKLPKYNLSSSLNDLESKLTSKYKPTYNIVNKNHSIDLTKEIYNIINSNHKTRLKVIEIIAINKLVSSKSIGKLLNKSTRTIERYRKSTIQL